MKKKYTCQHCNKFYSSIIWWFRHINNCKDSYTCNRCKKPFTSLNRWLQHLHTCTLRVKPKLTTISETIQ